MEKKPIYTTSKTGPDLLIIRVPNGILSRCGPSCYNSISPDCSCICHGSNHGLGYKTAVFNSISLINRFKKDNSRIELSSHSKKKLAKLLQLNILSADD